MEYTSKDLMELTNKQLSDVQQSLGQHLGTELEKKARELNSMIRDEKDRRRPYGF